MCIRFNSTGEGGKSTAWAKYYYCEQQALYPIMEKRKQK